MNTERQAYHRYLAGTATREDLRGEVQRLTGQLERWLTWSGGQYPDESPGNVIAWEADGTIVLDDGVTTWNPLRALAASSKGRPK